MNVCPLCGDDEKGPWLCDRYYICELCWETNIDRLEKAMCPWCRTNEHLTVSEGCCGAGGLQFVWCKGCDAQGPAVDYGYGISCEENESFAHAQARSLVERWTELFERWNRGLNSLWSGKP